MVSSEPRARRVKERTSFMVRGATTTVCFLPHTETWISLQVTHAYQATPSQNSGQTMGTPFVIAAPGASMAQVVAGPPQKAGSETCRLANSARFCRTRCIRFSKVVVIVGLRLLVGGFHAGERDSDLYSIRLFDKPAKEGILELPSVTAVGVPRVTSCVRRGTLI